MKKFCGWKRLIPNSNEIFKNISWGKLFFRIPKFLPKDHRERKILSTEDFKSSV